LFQKLLTIEAVDNQTYPACSKCIISNKILFDKLSKRAASKRAQTAFKFCRNFSVKEGKVLIYD
jgi:hypothetical protein